MALGPGFRRVCQWEKNGSETRPYDLVHAPSIEQVSRSLPLIQPDRPTGTTAGCMVGVEQLESHLWPFCAEVVAGRLLRISGADRDRTGDPLLAKQVLSQLSYRPDVLRACKLADSAAPPKWGCAKMHGFSH
jgi:hypothetical protein